MTWMELYLYLLFVLKMIELYFWVMHHLHPTQTSEYNLYQSDRLFSLCMACLMLYLFHPFVGKPIYIDHEIRNYLFMFAALSFFNFVPRPSLPATSFIGGLLS